MARDCTVTFTPDGISVRVGVGSTILDTAGKAGIPISSLCGGEGVCGKCRVIVRQGRVRAAASDLLTAEDIETGYVLACRGYVESDLTVEVPQRSRIEHAVEATGGPEDVFGESVLRQRYDAKLSPLVRKDCVELPPPSLENNAADLERLTHALSKKTGIEVFRADLKVIRRLPRILRGSDWRVTATTARYARHAEILSVEPGDATRRNMAVAVDVGTTTVVAHLIDLNTAQTLGARAKYNSQIRYGSDVIRRIIHAGKDGGLKELHDAVVGDVTELIGQLLQQHRLGFANVTLVTAAGNTTMMHLLIGIPPDWIRKEPFVGVMYRPGPIPAGEVGLKINPRGLVYCLPSVAAFVGADISAGVLATGLHKSADVRMLVDIGTNGEMVIGNRDFLVCASTSAGPAFEGAESEAGMRATRGAIDHLRLFDRHRPPSYTTIGSGPPVGICGTGYIDLLAGLLSVGLVDKAGRLQPDRCERIRANDRGVLEYVVAPSSEAGGDRDVVITQEDIANLLRAKGAIYSGACVLLNSLGMTFDDVREILVAGAFGNYIELENAITIGLLPDVPHEKLRFVGNSSITGAKLAALCHEKYEEVQNIASGMTYFELGTDPTFMDQFSRACFLPHTDIERFPRVMSRIGRQGMEVRN